MKDEIKDLKCLSALGNLQSFAIDGTKGSKIVDINVNIVKNHITNLQEELEDLREDNYVYHQLMKMQNKREFRSKFLKEFQEEFGTNTFPDYDEIYKRYDKVKKENEIIKSQLNVCSQDLYMENLKLKLENKTLKQKNEKAIEYINKHSEHFEEKYLTTTNDFELIDLKNILTGGDDNE